MLLAFKRVLRSFMFTISIPWVVCSILLLLYLKVRNVIILIVYFVSLLYMLLPVLFGINYQIFVIHFKSLFYHHKMCFEVFYMNYFKQVSSWHHMLCLWHYNNFFETNMASLKNFFKNHNDAKDNEKVGYFISLSQVKLVSTFYNTIVFLSN